MSTNANELKKMIEEHNKKKDKENLKVTQENENKEMEKSKISLEQESIIAQQQNLFLNITSVHITNIPVEMKKQQFLQFPQRFGQVKYMYYSPFVKGRAHFADVEYETHQQAESIARSSAQQRIFGGVILQVRWDMGQNTIKQKEIDKRIKMKKENNLDEEIEDGDRSENNAVNFQNFKSTMKNNEILKFVSRFGLVKFAYLDFQRMKFLIHSPNQQEDEKEAQNNKSVIVEYINKEGLNEALKANGSEFEGCKLKTEQYKSDRELRILNENLQDFNIIIDEIYNEIEQIRKQYEMIKKQISEKEQNDKEQEKLNEKQNEKEKDKQNEQENQLEIIRQQLKFDYNFLIMNIEHVKDQLERRIFSNDKNRIIGVKLLKLKREIDEQQIRSAFAKYHPKNIIIDIEQSDPRYNSASIHFDDPNISIQIVKEKDIIKLDGQIIVIKLKYQLMPLEEFRMWKRRKQNKQLYAILITGFPKELTLNEFFDFMDNKRIEAQGGFVSEEVGDTSSFAIAYFNNEDQQRVSIQQINGVLFKSNMLNCKMIFEQI